MLLKDNLAYTITESDFNKAFKKSLKYAIISLPWTINRMSYNESKIGIERRLKNITLGKIPELLVWEILKEYKIKAEAWAGQTDYWEIDKFDMRVSINDQKEEWDIKGLNLDFQKIKKDQWLQLPALIPDRHKKDQWSQRDKLYFKDSRQKRYLFVYLDDSNIKLDLSEEQLAAYVEISKNKKMYQHQADFILRKIGPLNYTIKKGNIRFVLSALAGRNEWPLFEKIKPSTVFLDGLIKTRIANMGVELEKLPSFLEIIGKSKLS